MRVEREQSQRGRRGGRITVAHLSKSEHGRTNPTWASVTAIAAALRSPVREVAARFEEIDLGR